jgi:hypothetical protein
LPPGVVLSLLQAAKENMVATVAAAAKLACRNFILLTMKAVTVLGSYSVGLARFNENLSNFPERARLGFGHVRARDVIAKARFANTFAILA